MSNNPLALTVEQVQAFYFDKEALREPHYKLYRISTPKGRYYYSFDENGKPIVFMGMTTMLGETMRQPEGLIKWIAEMGWEKSREYMNVKASYGSLMHTEIANYHLNNRIYDLDKVEQVVRQYVDSQPRYIRDSEFFDLHGWVDDIKHDMVSWDAFVKKHNLVPIAIEIALAHPEGYSGTLDIACFMDIQDEGDWGEVYKNGENKGKPKITKKWNRYRCIVDAKSTRKGTAHEDKKFQLHGYKKMWDWNFPDAPIQRTFNWSPKDWRNAPDWTLSEKTGSVEDAEFDAMISLAKRRLGGKDPVYIDLNGQISPDTAAKDYIKLISLEEHIILQQEARAAAREETPTGPAPDPILIAIEDLQMRISDLYGQIETLTAKPVRKPRTKKAKAPEIFDSEIALNPPI